MAKPGPYSAAAMHKRDRWMVDNADLILALYNGDLKGGTFATVNYARSRGKTVVNVWQRWELVEPLPF